MHKLIPNCVALLKPITDLTSKRADELIKWTSAFEKIRVVNYRVSAKTVLPHVIQTNASISQIRAVLLQQEDDGELYPVLYASRKLLSRESRYAIS